MFLALVSAPLLFGDKLFGLLVKKTSPKEFKDKIAFIETIYPLFDFDQLLKDVDTILKAIIPPAESQITTCHGS